MLEFIDAKPMFGFAMASLLTAIEAIFIVALLAETRLSRSMLTERANRSMGIGYAMGLRRAGISADSCIHECKMRWADNGLKEDEDYNLMLLAAVAQIIPVRVVG